MTSGYMAFSFHVHTRVCVCVTDELGEVLLPFALLFQGL